MKLEGTDDKNMTEPNFSEIFSFWGKAQKFLHAGFFGFCKKFNPLMCFFFTLKSQGSHLSGKHLEKLKDQGKPWKIKALRENSGKILTRLFNLMTL